jgi:Zn-dependent protease
MKIATIRNISITLHFSTVLIVVLVGINAGTFYASNVPGVSMLEIIIFGLLSGIAILVSILVHELMHSLTSLKYGVKVSEIELFLFGGVSKLRGEPKHPSDEIKIAFYGPLTSLSIGGLALIASLLVLSLNSFAYWFLFFMGTSNLLLGVFNLLPGFPLDGGRILRAILWKRRGNLVSATYTASRVGVVFGYLISGIGFIQIFLFGDLSGIWQIVVGNYLASTAKQSYNAVVYLDRLSKYQLDDLMLRTETISYWSSLSEAAQNFSIYRRPFFFVEKNGELVGILPFQILKRFLGKTLPFNSVGQVMTRLEDLPIISSTATPEGAIQALAESSIGVIKVMDNLSNHIVGFIDQDTIQTILHFSQYIRK